MDISWFIVRDLRPLKRLLLTLQVKAAPATGIVQQVIFSQILKSRYSR